jgi:hypothetical protein
VPDASRFGIYFSHSWRPRDVDLNIQAWEELAGDCEILVDVPEEPGVDPPYFINRIEELLRRTDLFVGILTQRTPKAGDFTPQDAYMRCSPYTLFEIRLAERADIPRLILYERSTGFRPPKGRPWEVYVPFDRGMKGDRIDDRQWELVIRGKIRQWKEWVTGHRRPASYEQSTSAAMLINSGSAAYPSLEQCVRDGGYEPVPFDPGRARSSEAFRILREAGLVVAEFGVADGIRSELYAAAHGLGIPAVRLMFSEGKPADLPWILRGDPGGYEHDIVRWSTPEDLPPLVRPRVASMFRLSPALRDENAQDYLQSKRYSQFFVFISHTLKPPERELVDRIYTLLKQRHVTPFEYHQVNTAGLDWKEALKSSLKKTTHFVALLSDEYEKSQTCTYEIEEILSRGSEVSILPFMIGGRAVPHPKLSQMHNFLLEGNDVNANAQTVAQQIMERLNDSLNRPRP